MKTLLIIGVLFCVYKLITSARAHRAEQERERQEEQRQAEAARLRNEWRNVQAEAKVAIMKQEAMWKEQERQRKEQERQAKEQVRLAKEQERQAAQLERHEEMLMKLDHRLASAESEIAFNREQRERIFSLLEIEEAERDACIKGSTAWQKHQKKVIALENQVHTVQKRIDKAQADKRFCESKLA